MKIAIVGSSHLSEGEERTARQVSSTILKNYLKQGTVTLISGGAKGVDTQAEDVAKQLGIECKIFKPAEQNWDGYKVRNLRIAQECDILYCLPTKPKILVINGEPVDGSNPRSLGDSVWSTNYLDQMTDVEKLIKMIPHEKIYLTSGSPYHSTREATNFEKIFGKKIGAESYTSVIGNETMADFEATFKVFDKHIHFTHHVGYSGWWMYRPTPIARELVKMHFQHRENGFHTDLLVRSHVHYYVEVRFPNTIGLSTPAWKFPDGFLYKQGEPEMPTVGNIEVIVESNGKIIVEPHLAPIKWEKPVINV